MLEDISYLSHRKHNSANSKKNEGLISILLYIIPDISVWIQTSFNIADINQFIRHTGKQ